MSNAKYIGRVGALAVALGIGTAVATTPGVAMAEPPPDSSSAADSASSNASPASTDSTSKDDTKPASSVDGSSGTHTAANTPDVAQPADEEPAEETDSPATSVRRRNRPPKNPRTSNQSPIPNRRVGTAAGFGESGTANGHRGRRPHRTFRQRRPSACAAGDRRPARRTRRAYRPSAGRCARSGRARDERRSQAVELAPTPTTTTPTRRSLRPNRFRLSPLPPPPRLQ